MYSEQYGGYTVQHGIYYWSVQYRIWSEQSGKALYSAVRDMVFTVGNMVCPCTVWDMVSTKRGLLSVQYGIKIYGGHGRLK